MKIIDTIIADVKIIEPSVYTDKRGFFLETYKKTRYQQLLNINFDFVQDNYSRSTKGVLRGLHFQKKNPQGKLVRVVNGTVFDVAVDIRPKSMTFGKWVGVFLSSKKKNQLWIPPGLAHGFCVLSDTADFEYKCTDYYYPEHEGCLLWDDVTVGIKWPIDTPLLSPKDRDGVSLLKLLK